MSLVFEGGLTILVLEPLLIMVLIFSVIGGGLGVGVIGVVRRSCCGIMSRLRILRIAIGMLTS